MYYWLPDNEIVFPHPDLASPEGILALGGDLSPQRLLTAYANGIFPWYSHDEPIIWWCPDPRFVLYPQELKVSKSMRPYFNGQKLTVTYDQHFAAVIGHCKSRQRPGQDGTWITPDMEQAYIRLHELGFAHSVEVWDGFGVLVGGVYGVSLGSIFFGESMFSLQPNASKFGFISLVRRLQDKGFTLIDCQQETTYLGSLGARLIARQLFLEELQTGLQQDTWTGSWQEND